MADELRVVEQIDPRAIEGREEVAKKVGLGRGGLNVSNSVFGEGFDRSKARVSIATQASDTVGLQEGGMVVDDRFGRERWGGFSEGVDDDCLFRVIYVSYREGEGVGGPAAGIDEAMVSGIPCRSALVDY